MLAGCTCMVVALVVVVCYGEEVVGDVVDVVVTLCDVLGLRKALWKCCDYFEMGKLDFHSLQ